LWCFFYALTKTDGNVLKSLQFALYFLAIKIGFIAPNVLLELNQDQSNQQLVSRVQPLPVYNPYGSVLDDYRLSGLYMRKVERPSLVSQHSHSQKLMNELRAGDSRLTQAAWLLMTIWMLQHQSVGFQPINQSPLPPNIKSARNLLFGKPKPDQFSCRQLSSFNHQEFKTIDPYSSEVLSKENALALITEEYGTLEDPKFDYIDRSLGLTAPRQQLAAKTYHAPSYKLYPELYGISQAQTKAINDYGLVGYVERGGKLPSSAFVGAYHQHVKTFFARNRSTLNLNGSYRGEPAIIVHNEITGEVLIFRSDTKQLWTPSHLKSKQMLRYIETGGVGKGGEVPIGTAPPPKII
jgi:hypothetical protein